MQKVTTLTVLGAGYVGLTTATLLSHAGYIVSIVEPNQKRLDAIRQGRSFFYEEGIDPLIAAAIKNGSLLPTDSYEESVPKSSIVFSCVGTPDNPDGSSNLTYVFDAAKHAAGLMSEDALYVQKSTVPVGTGRKIEALFAQRGTPFPYISNPEFLREGTAIYDTLNFDRVVVGGDNQKAVKQIIRLYAQLENHRDRIARLAGITLAPPTGRSITTGLNSAELTKVTANAFLALKISFANSIAQLADTTGADVVEVMDAVGADARIGRAFLNAGRGYGGGCFPKDVSGLISSAREFGVNLAIIEAAQAVNDAMPGYILEKLQVTIGGSLESKKVAVLGLAFKAGTSDVRRSPGIALANALQRLGATVTTYDPQANEEAAPDIHPGIVQQETIEAATEGADALIISTDWPELTRYSPQSYAALLSKGGVFVDAVNAFNSDAIRAAGLIYLGVGRR